MNKIEMTLGEIRKELILLIVAGRKEYFRLKNELDNIGAVLPEGTFLSTYTSNTKAENGGYTYFRLANKKSKKQYHLGNAHNPRFLQGILDIEKMQLTNTKHSAKVRIKIHLDALKQNLKVLRLLINKFGFDHTFKNTDLKEYMKNSKLVFDDTWLG